CREGCATPPFCCPDDEMRADDTTPHCMCCHPVYGWQYCAPGATGCQMVANNLWHTPCPASSTPSTCACADDRCPTRVICSPGCPPIKLHLLCCDRRNHAWRFAECGDPCWRCRWLPSSCINQPCCCW